MATTQVIEIGNNQAIRFPSEMHTDHDNLIIKKIGETYIAYPVDDPWLPLRQVIGTFPEEYMLDRDQPVWEEVTNRTQF